MTYPQAVNLRTRGGNIISAACTIHRREYVDAKRKFRLASCPYTWHLHSFEVWDL